MARRPSTWIAAGQIGFVGFLVVAVALHPGFVLKADEGGISNYGIHLRTTVPYTLAFLAGAGCSIVAARLLQRRDPGARMLRNVLMVYSALLLATLLSTYGYTVDEELRQAHLTVGTVTLVFEAAASVWMALCRRSPQDATWLAVQLLGSALAGLTALGVLHLLFLGQALAAVGFGLLLVRTGLATSATGRANLTSRP